MSNAANNNQYLKCPHCACIFFAQADLDAHLKRFGNTSAQHIDEYKKVHGRIEHGYGGGDV